MSDQLKRPHLLKETSAMRSNKLAPQSPIHSLPVELLSYIFVLATHSPPDICEDGRALQKPPCFNADSVKTPVIYTAVSQHWRNVAFGTAALWTSICITIGSVQTDIANQSKSLNFSHITSYLSLSKKCPLNILLDIRDSDWDFSEPEIPTSEFCDYVPPFSEDDVRAYLSLLLPHISRWQSIDILTDTWAPMYTALSMLNESLMAGGAPVLESLTLMRANDFVSHSPVFEPSRLRIPRLFNSEGLTEPNYRSLLPRLRHVTLRGVHVDWTNLSRLLQPTLSSLELSSHSLDIRPTIHEFRDVLRACPKLKSLIVNGSGFVSDDEGLGLKTGVHINNNVERVALPLLEELTIGFRSVVEGCDMLALIHAPNIGQLSLEDASHPAEVDDLEADEVLLFVAGCNFDPVQTSRTPQRFCPCTGSFADRSSSPFPALQKLILTGVRAQTDVLRKVFTSMPHLQSLKIHALPKPMDAIHALLPASATRVYGRVIDSELAPSGFILCPSLSSSPCPSLQELSLRSGRLSKGDLSFITSDFLVRRLDSGVKSLDHIDVHLVDGAEPSYDEFIRESYSFRGCDIRGEDGISIGILMELDVGSLLSFSAYTSDQVKGMSTGVRIFKAPLVTEDADDSTSDAHIDEASLYGGIFNDPIFDAQYGSAFSQ